MGIEDSKLYQDYFKEKSEKDPKKNAQKGSSIFLYKDWLCLLPLLPAMGFIAISVIGVMESYWQIKSWPIPLIVFNIFVSLLFLFFAIVIYCENHKLQITKIMMPIYAMIMYILIICILFYASAEPTIRIYHCENNICRYRDYALVNTIKSNNSFIVDETYERIGVSSKEIVVEGGGRGAGLARMFAFMCNKLDKYNLVKFKNANGKSVRLLSWHFDQIPLLFIGGFLTLLFIILPLCIDNQKCYYVLLSIILSRILYVVLFV